MKNLRIVLTRKWPSEVEEYLSSKYDADIRSNDDPIGQKELRSIFARSDIVLSTVSDNIDENILSCPDSAVRMICNYGVGYEHIDLDACRARGIVVTNTPDILSDATAELALTIMLMLARRAGEGERQLRSSNWIGWGTTSLLGTTLAGKTLGLVGFGRIAKALAAKAAAGFGMKIRYHARNRAAAEEEDAYCATYCERLDDLLRSSDIVSLHCPGGRATQNLIGADQLRAMKKSAYIA